MPRSVRLPRCSGVLGEVDVGERDTALELLAVRPSVERPGGRRAPYQNSLDEGEAGVGIGEGRPTRFL